MAVNLDGSRPPRLAKDHQWHVLKLFITGMSPRSLRAVDQIKLICQRYLPGNHELEIIDLYQHPTMASSNQIIATPTLLQVRPEPAVRILGDLSDTKGVLGSLGIVSKELDSTEQDRQ